jgi:molecular chaperone DnaJ
MSKRDFYEVLGVSRTATEVDMKVSFRKLAMKFHPDRNPGDAEAEIKFKEINEAYQILMDPQQRAAYDRHGHAAFEQGRGGAGFGDGFASSMADIFEDLFGDFAGRQRGGRGQGGRERGSDLRYNLEITLEEAYAGKTAELKIPTAMSCEACTGTGAKAGSKAKTCSTCGGHGRVRAQQGFFAIERTCMACQGRGETIENPCPSCRGDGRVMKERNLSVNIPAGVEDGTRIRLANEGEGGLRGGPSGDLYIFLSVKPHQLFQRDGADLFCRVPISMANAALGADIKVPTLDGQEAEIAIPEGTQTGKQFPIKGRGMTILRTKNRGDLYIQVVVETPRNLNARQRELLKEFLAESNGDNQPESEGFFSKVRDFFAGGS